MSHTLQPKNLDFLVDVAEVAVDYVPMKESANSHGSWLLLALASILFCLPAYSGGVVTNASQHSLLAAMAGGGAVTFGFDGTIYLTNTIIVSNNTVLDASGQNVTISGSNAVQIFIVTSGTTLAMTNLTLINGLAQGAPNWFTALAGCGGAISNAGTLQMTCCTFISNTAVGTSQTREWASEGDGGAVYNSGSVTAWGCIFVGNLAVGGIGGAQLDPPASDGGAANGGAFLNANQATFVNCVFSNNTATGGVGSNSHFDADDGSHRRGLS
jgi:hypothetical protein